MQHDHQNKVEMLRLDHLKEMNNIKQKFMDEVKDFGSTNINYLTARNVWNISADKCS